MEKTQYGCAIFVTLHKVEFAENHTSVFFTIENKNTEDSKALLLTPIVIQGKKQISQGYSADHEHRYIPLSILGGTQVQGVVKFNALDYNKDKVTFEFKLVLVRAQVGCQFVFDVVISD